MYIITIIEGVCGIIKFISNYILNRYYIPECGNFDNPAGFASLLSSMYPYSLYVTRITKKRIKRIIQISIILIIISVLLSTSRTGILCIVIISLLYIINRKKTPYRMFTLFAIIFLMVVLYVLYNINKNSANGRLFIWKRSFEMIMQRPLEGYGIGGFKAQYMKFQADFFEKNQNTLYTMIADDVNFAYNEFINIAINYGLIGILFTLFFLVCIIICYNKNHHYIKKYAALSCLSITFFSCFSFPLYYPSTWLILVVNLIIITKPIIYNILSYLRESKVKYPFVVCGTIFSLVFALKTTIYARTELDWKINNDLYRNTKSNKAVKEYKRLYNDLKMNPHFLYNYAIILLNEKRYDESLIIAKQSNCIWKNYDTEILLGNIEEQRKNYENSLTHYRTASYMCPAKFYPLVQIQQIYKKNGDINSAKEWAIKIINKPEKIKNNRTIQIKKLMKHELELRDETDAK